MKFTPSAGDFQQNSHRTCVRSGVAVPGITDSPSYVHLRIPVVSRFVDEMPLLVEQGRARIATER